MDEEVQRRLLEAFPTSTYAMTVRGVREGVILADDFMKSAKFLLLPTGKDLTGHIRRAGVLSSLHEMCVKGDLPFSSKITKMARANWHQLEMRSGKFTANLVRTDDELAFPEDSPSRQDERVDNQGDLFKNPKVVPISEAISQIQELSAWLTYKLERSGRLAHLCWAVPQNDSDEWLGHINIISAAGSELPKPASEPPVTPDPRAAMRFHDDIAEALKNLNADDTPKDNSK